MASKCFKLNPGLADNLPTCSNCKRLGHTADKCRSGFRPEGPRNEQHIPEAHVPGRAPVKTICKINPAKSPSIIAEFPFAASLLLNTGATPNLLKLKALNEAHQINEKDILHLCEITDEIVPTLIPDDFALKQDAKNCI